MSDYAAADGGLTKVEVSTSEPPATPHRRIADAHWSGRTAAVVRWTFAPLVEHWRGISLTRLIAIALVLVTDDIAHDWLKAQPVAYPLGWAFVAFVLAGLFLAVITALGAKYIDKLLAIVAAKLGVALTTAPIPGTTTTAAPPAPTS